MARAPRVSVPNLNQMFFRQTTLRCCTSTTYQSSQPRTLSISGHPWQTPSLFPPVIALSRNNLTAGINSIKQLLLFGFLRGSSQEKKWPMCAECLPLSAFALFDLLSAPQSGVQQDFSHVSILYC